MHPSYVSDHLQDEAVCVETLLKYLKWDPARARRVELQAGTFVRSIRDRKGGVSEIETFLEQYPLQSEEGLALMTLAEALLRIPDSATADALIAEKMKSGNWQASNATGLFKLAGVGLGLAQKTLGSFLGDLGRPVIRKSMEEAVRRIGQQFVMGETIGDALHAARKAEAKGYRLSYDMLGEGARTQDDADRYFDSYADAAVRIGSASEKNVGVQQKAGMSVKLSALHPRYIWTQRERCIPELIEKLSLLCQRAASYNIPLTVDAEEADRLEMAIEIISAVAAKKEFRDWQGFGLAVQAYDKRTFRLIDTIGTLAADTGHHLQVRLVKGAYWDSEIKRAQVAGLQDYALFTRKMNTDVSYLACAQKLMSYRDRLYPMFATHNANTVAAILELSGGTGGFEFQRLHGMGESLGNLIVGEKLAPVTIYAPVGPYEDLLAYLVRRMLENGANTSFLNKIRNKNAAADELVADTVTKVAAHPSRQQKLPLPEDIYGPTRKNSAGPDLSCGLVRDDLLQQILPSQIWRGVAITPIIDGQHPIKSGGQQAHVSPANTAEVIADVWDTTADKIESAVATARLGFAEWSQFPAAERGEILRRYADLLETNSPRLIGLLQHEGGKTLLDCISEIREAVDFCRYYAAEGEHLFAAEGQKMPGPTGEDNRLKLEGKGVFVCISPWNFPLAIFTGQIAAALMAGNAVIAKPAEQTPIVAFEAVKLWLDAGLPPKAITLLPGDGRIGAALVEHDGIDGVAFTGSTEVAQSINRALAAKDGPIATLIAETGGQNAMIVDSTALPEQVIDDVLISAFGSTGQRCSALRVLYVQDDSAPALLAKLEGAMRELNVGDPRLYSTDIGPVIDADAHKTLTAHIDQMRSTARFIGQAPLPQGLPGYFIPPIAFEIKSLAELKREVFGPVLHVIRYAAKDREKIIAEINSSGYGLTFGVHSRLQDRITETAHAAQAGNIYVNRSMIGAVVGVQPFGGRGLSGTGPKAGGPYYLHRFATEKTVSVNTTATGGNIALLSMLED